MKNYRVRVETNDGCVTIWHEKSKAKSAPTLINNRVYNQLCGLNIKEIEVTLQTIINVLFHCLPIHPINDVLDHCFLQLVTINDVFSHDDE